MADNSTKDLIIDTIRSLMNTTPLRKLKVQDVMQVTGMTRQCFYYHFQDIYQAVEWEVDRKLIQQVPYSPDRDCPTWTLAFLAKVDEDPDFYRRFSRNVDLDTIRRLIMPNLLMNVNDYLFQDPNPNPADLQPFQLYSANMIAEIILLLFVNHMNRKDELAREEFEQKCIACRIIMEGLRKELLDHDTSMDRGSH